MDALFQNFNSETNKKLLEWKLDDEDLYNRFTQGYTKPYSDLQSMNLYKPIEEQSQKCLSNSPMFIENKTENIEEITQNESHKKRENIVSNIPKPKYNKQLQNVEEVSTNKEIKSYTPILESLACMKQKRKSPYDVIIELSCCVPMNFDYIKQKLIDFIAQKEFQTIFGVKKTSETMKGIIENKWNKSLVIFLSFIFDTVFVYLKKEVVFNTENSKKIIVL